MTDKNTPYLISNEEFERLITSIDDELKESGVPIPHREIKAVLMMANRLQVDFVMGTPGVYGEDHDRLLNQIRVWFIDRYGDLLNRNFLIGEVVLSLNKDIWVMSIPRVVHHARFYTEPLAEPRVALGQVISGGRYNIIDYIRTMPTGVRRDLSEDELLYIRDLFILGLNLYSGLKEIRKTLNLNLVKEANIDYETSVHHLKLLHPNFGQSKWSSLQATEKMYKAYIEHKGYTFERVHDLIKLDEALDKIKGRPPIERKDLKLIQTSPSVRYGDPIVTKAEAINAHHASLKIGEILSRSILETGSSYFERSPLK